MSLTSQQTYINVLLYINIVVPLKNRQSLLNDYQKAAQINYMTIFKCFDFLNENAATYSPADHD